jgi:hypothetical protein
MKLLLFHFDFHVLLLVIREKQLVALYFQEEETGKQAG